MPPSPKGDLIRHGLKQIQGNPGGIILDYGENNISLDELQAVLDGRIKRTGIAAVDIIIVCHGRAVKVLRYKK